MNNLGAKAERDRIAAINALPETKGCEDRAMTLAMTTDMTVDQVRATLGAEISAMWDAALASRGMKVGAQGASESAGAWDEVMKRKGFAVGAGA